MIRRLFLHALLLLAAVSASAQGVPFLETFTPEEYGGHCINFDIKTGQEGTVFVANFEGLMYYNHAAWTVLHTSGITRVTTTFCDSNNNIWAGGYNYFGRVDRQPNGQLILKRVGGPDLFRGEVLEMWEKDGYLMFVASNGVVYKAKDFNVSVDRKLNMDASRIGLTDIIKPETIDETGMIEVLSDITQEEPMALGLKAIVQKGKGVSIVDEEGHEIYKINEQSGLVNENVSWVNYDGHGRLWGATEDGIFTAAVPSAFTHFSTKEGIDGDILDIKEFGHHVYMGTIDGLYRLDGQTLTRVPDIDYACWDLLDTTDGLMAATTDGTWLINATGTARQLSTTNAMSLLDDGDYYYCGQFDGVWHVNKRTNERKKVCNLEKVFQIVRDAENTIWLRSTFGEVWFKRASSQKFQRYTANGAGESASTFVLVNGKVIVVKAEDKEPFSYPSFAYTDSTGVTWLTDEDCKHIYRWKDGKRLTDLDKYLYPFADISVRALFVQNDKIWLGTNKGLIIIDTKLKDPILETMPRMLIRRITLGNDSILWGGYGTMPESLPTLDNNSNLSFIFSLDYEAMVGETVYRYRIDDTEWSIWDDDHEAQFLNLSSGSHTFYVQGRDAFGRETEVVSIDFKVLAPFYFRWYMNLLYLILAGLLVYGISIWRMRSLKRDKIMLEKIVEERTAEVKSAQKQLIKQEKMATVGKLTQGLIDRILNPLNYINNFSKLSEGLVKDVKANIEDEEEHMDKENFEDTMDVLDMLSGNLQKVGEHGQNTTRTLKAMEEMLKDRSGGIVDTDLCAILRQNEEMVGTYYAKDISEHHIRIVFEYPDTPVHVNVHPDLLSKVFMSMVANSVYAVVKKYLRAAYEPEVSIKAAVSNDRVTINFYDNGIGMEEKILDKIFDPFFTTKTTGEAAGIGLYLSHDIIQNYGGDITARSVKDEFTEFTITLPIQTASAYGKND